MAITNTATQPNQFGGIPGMGMPGQSNNGLPSLNLGQGIQTQGVDPSKLQTDPSQVYSLLSNAPQSLTATLGPLLQQIYGMQGNLMQGTFQQQGAQGAAQAQSDAMKRGLTGSSIEGAGMQQAYGQANQGFNQYMASILQNLIPQYSQAAQFDIGNQQGYYGNLAQAVGQNYASEIQQKQFQQQLQAGLDAASQSSNAQMWAGIASGLGSAVGGGIAKYSDIRLKDNVRPVGSVWGLNVYRFTFKQKAGLNLPKDEQLGFLAHEVAAKYREAVKAINGYLCVNYGVLAREAA